MVQLHPDTVKLHLGYGWNTNGNSTVYSTLVKLVDKFSF